MDRINSLIETIEKTFEELQTEYFNMWDNDAELQEAFQLLEQSTKYCYNVKGLNRYIDMEFDFDEYSEDAFYEYAHSKDVFVDLRNSYSMPSTIYKPIHDYLALVEEEDGIYTAVISSNGEEDTVDTGLHFRNEDERNEYLHDISSSRNIDVLTVVVDSWRNVTVVDFTESTEFAS